MIIHSNLPTLRMKKMTMVDLAAWSAAVLVIILVKTVSSADLFKLTFFGLDHASNTDFDSPPNGSDIESSVMITKQWIEM